MISRRQALAALLASGLGLAFKGPSRAETGQEAASRGHALLQAGNTAAAVTALKEAARLDPTNPWVFNLLGRAYHQAGQAGLAAENFRMALRIDPADGYARMLLDIIAQRPLPAMPPGHAGARQRKPSRVEEEARAEMESFTASGRSPHLPLILLDPGHGGADKGVAGASGLAEKDAAFALASAMAARINASGAAWAVMTREGDHAVPLWARTWLGGLLGAGLFVSVHCGAGLAGRGGLECLVYAPQASDEQAAAVADLENGVVRFERSQAPPVSQQGAADLAFAWNAQRNRVRSEETAKALAGSLNLPKPLDKATVRRAPLRVLDGVACPAMLLEVGFLSNPAEEELLRDPARRDAAAEEIALALTRGLG